MGGVPRARDARALLPRFSHAVVHGLQKEFTRLSQVSVLEMRQGNEHAFVVTQKRATQDNPKVSDLYDLGTLVKVLQLLKLPDGTVKILVEGVERSKVLNIYDNGECFEAEVAKLVEEEDENG